MEVKVCLCCGCFFRGEEHQDKCGCTPNCLECKNPCNQKFAEPDNVE